MSNPSKDMLENKPFKDDCYDLEERLNWVIFIHTVH